MIYFTIYLFLEVLLTVEVASRLGGLLMFAEIVVSAFIGMRFFLIFALL